MTQPSRPGQPNRSVERSSTLIETEEEIREAILSGLKGQQQAVPVDRPVAPPSPIAQPPGQAAQPIPTAQPPAVPAANAVSPYRPTSRPPLAILTVFDDGKSEGEMIRIRAAKFTIGRTEGDLRIPIDGRISSRHVEITLQVVRRRSPLGRHRPPEHPRHVRAGQPDGAQRPGRVPGRERPLPIRDVPRSGRSNHQ